MPCFSPLSHVRPGGARLLPAGQVSGYWRRHRTPSPYYPLSTGWHSIAPHNSPTHSFYTSAVWVIICMCVLPTSKSADIMRTSLYYIPKVQKWSFCCRKSWFYFNDNSTRKYFDSFLIFYREKVDKKFCCQSSWVCPHSEHVEMPLSRQEKIFMESQFLTPFQSDILVLCSFMYNLLDNRYSPYFSSEPQSL